MNIEEFITVFEWIVGTFLNWFLSTSSVFLQIYSLSLGYLAPNITLEF
jgi:hypothetical protein